jgi:hypothetical protein
MCYVHPPSSSSPSCHKQCYQSSLLIHVALQQRLVELVIPLQYMLLKSSTRQFSVFTRQIRMQELK